MDNEEQKKQEELVIDDSNFSEYFFEINKHGPKKGQILARYTAIAEFVDSDVKQYVIETLLTNPKGAEMASQVMKYHCHATDEYATTIPLEISRDLREGMSRDEIAAKVYKFQVEWFYWTMREYVPVDDIHWEVITISKAEWEQAYKDIDDMEQKEKEADNPEKTV